MFGLTVSPLELLLRGTVMYLFLFALFRVVVKRRVGRLPLDRRGVILVGTPSAGRCSSTGCPSASRRSMDGCSRRRSF
jgi:hypothetical protein